MRKPKFLALVLVVAVMLMGAGYAQWTDVLDIKNTVTTGDMNVEFILEGSMAWDSTYTTANITRSLDNKTETVTLTDMYPGSVAVYCTAIENKGTLPAQIQGVIVDLDTTVSPKSQDLATRMGYIAGYIVVDENGYSVPGKLGFTAAYDLATLESNLSTMLAGVVLEPGEKLYFDIPEENKADAIEFMPQYAELEDNCFVFGLPHCITNAEGLENEEVAFDITLNFGQANTGYATDYSVNLDNR